MLLSRRLPSGDHPELPKSGGTATHRGCHTPQMLGGGPSDSGHFGHTCPVIVDRTPTHHPPSLGAVGPAIVPSKRNSAWLICRSEFDSQHGTS